MSALVIERIGPGVTVQAGERAGHMHEGVPPGGALVPELLVAANASVGNSPDAPAIEIPLHAARFRAEGDVLVSVDGEPRLLRDGDVLEVSSTHEAVRYVAVSGGVRVPRVLGGQGTLLVARLGGLDGRMLRKGDRLEASDPAHAPNEANAPAPDDAPIRLVLGPDDFPGEALDALLTSAFTVSPATNRVGMRLDGMRLPNVPGDRPFSAPMVRGALQVTHDGSVIVLGPDHPTTGGYPVIACVVSADWGRLARRRPGSEVRFAVYAPSEIPA